MLIAVDDTDSRQGMCTTFLATELIKEFQEYSLTDHPRLVRLNPNVPWKTRGNGAVVLSLGPKRERGNEKQIGDIGGSIRAAKGDDEIDGGCENKRDIFHRTKEVVEKWSETDVKGTNPGLVIADSRPPRKYYEDAVKGVVELKDILTYLKRSTHLFQGYKNGRGLIGATSALAWTPEDFTYEFIAYRKKDRWGTERDIEEDSVKQLDSELEHSFDTYDHRLDKQVVSPNSPCPVLYGVRGDEPEELKESLNIVKNEQPARWLIFLTNQGTDDHIQKKRLTQLTPWESVKVKGTVNTEPRVIEGGHVFFEFSDGDEQITAAAYEPTKTFRDIVKRLIPGDELMIWGGVRKEPRSINIEKIKVLKTAEKVVKVGNPICPKCKTRMSSIGKNAGFRCKKCSEKAKESDIETKTVEREIEPRYYETPVVARRHLSKPLKRIKRS